MNKVIITGASGFIGRNLVRHFSRKSWLVYGVDSNAEENAPMADLAGYYSLRLPSDKFGSIVHEIQPELCVQCAGGASVGFSVADPLTDFLSGPVLTWEVLNSIRLNASHCRSIFLSSAAVYGSPKELPIGESHPMEPISPYGFHKLQSELVCNEFAKLYGLPIAIARIFSAYGPGLRRQVIWDLFHQVITDASIKAQGTGAESRDFIHVNDLNLAVEIIAGNALFAGEAYNVACGQETTIGQLAGIIRASISPDCGINFNGEIPPGTPTRWCADVSALRQLGFSPAVSIEAGVKGFGDWCRAELLSS